MKPQLLLLMFCAVWAIADCSSIDFPGTVEKVASPNRRFLIENRHPNGGNDVHSLFLIDRRAHRRRLLHQYGRSVSVLWAPDSRHVAITDHNASDESTVLVYDTAALRRVDLRARLAADDAAIRTLLGNHHAYLVARCFIGNEQILINLNGYGDQTPAGFERCYKITLSTMSVETSQCR